MKRLFRFCLLFFVSIIMASCTTSDEVVYETPSYTIVYRDSSPYYYYYGHYYLYPPRHYYYRPRPNYAIVPPPKPHRHRPEATRPSRPHHNNGHATTPNRPHNNGNRPNGNAGGRRR